MVTRVVTVPIQTFNASCSSGTGVYTGPSTIVAGDKESKVTVEKPVALSPRIERKVGEVKAPPTSAFVALPELPPPPQPVTKKPVATRSQSFIKKSDVPVALPALPIPPPPLLL